MTEPKQPKPKKGPKTVDDLIRQKTESFNKSSKKRNRKATRTRKVPKSFIDLMGAPPLLSDEDPAQYFALYEMLRLKFLPRDILEELYVRQIMDDAWLVTRYRRMNSHILNMAQPGLGDEIRLKIDRYRNKVMGSEELLDQRTENLILHDFSQLACFSHPSDMIAKQFEKRIVEINLIEGMISRCMERMRRSHVTLEEMRAFLDHALDVVTQDDHQAPQPSQASQASGDTGAAQDIDEHGQEICDGPSHAGCVGSNRGTLQGAINKAQGGSHGL